MKKILLLLSLLFFCSGVSAFAQDAILTDEGVVILEEEAPSKFKTAVNRIKVKRYAKRFVKAKLNKDNQKAHDELGKFFEYGGVNSAIKIYSPCPCRKHITVNGKQIDAKNKRCVVFEYKYNDKDYAVAKCKKNKKKKVNK